MEKFGHDVLDRQPQICISSGECKTVLPPACVRAHPPCSVSAHLAHSLRINCIPAKERARWGAGGRFSPFVGLVWLQGESFEILPPMCLLVCTLLTPPHLPHMLFTTRLSWVWSLQAQFPVMLHGAGTSQMYAGIQINNACLLTSAKAIRDKMLHAPSASRCLLASSLLPRQKPSNFNCAAINNRVTYAYTTFSLGKWLVYLL